MYYEIYVDVLFLVNFMMDYILLSIVKRMLSCTATHGRICLGAVTGSFLTCVVILLPIPYPLIKLILFHVFVNTCMIQVGLKTKDIRSFLKAMCLLYIGSFLLGGIMEAFRQYVRIGSLFFVIALAGYYLVLGIWKFIFYMHRWKQCHCRVELYLENEKFEIKGMIDTGNGLRDPISNQPVNIIDRRTARKLFGEKSLKDVRYIPYRSIGKKEGVLPAFQFEKMRVWTDTPHLIEKPWIAISEEDIGTRGEYEMILNPKLF